jgi:hypothetical protein
VDLIVNDAGTVGDRLSMPLLDKNTEPGTVIVSLLSDQPLPTGGLNASNELVFAPAPEEAGSYEFTLVARLGSLESRRTVKLNVAADPIKTTRVSGTVNATSGFPLAGVRVAIGDAQAVTDPNGRFEVTLPDGALVPPLRVLGYQSSDQKGYIGLTSDLTSLLGRQLYQGANNVLAQPIFLSSVAPVKAIDATNREVEVTNSLLPSVNLKIAAGTLVNSIGQVVTAGISLTEIPLDRAPSNIPEVASPDFILSIETGGAKFSKGAILTVANRVGYAAGTRMNLWGLNSTTGQFEIVSEGVVSEDSKTVQSVGAGILQGGIYFFAPVPVAALLDEDNPLTPSESNVYSAASVTINSEANLDDGSVTDTQLLAGYQSLGVNHQFQIRYNSKWAKPLELFQAAYQDFVPGQN